MPWGITGNAAGSRAFPGWLGKSGWLGKLWAEWLNPPVPQSKLAFYWPLRLIAALSLIGPAVIFAYSSWETYREIDAQANERIEHSLDVLQEHAQKSLQTVERSISEINEVLGNTPDETIRARESDYYLRLKRTQQALPQIEAIWVFDREGRPLISSTIYPVPRDLNNSERSYFAAQKDFSTETYISEVIRAKIGTLSFFVVSGRRQNNDARAFNGIIAVTVMPGHFSEFYGKLSRGHDAFGLVRADGPVLARYPEVPNANPAAMTQIPVVTRGSPSGGFYTTRSAVDGVERRNGYRLVPGFPLYVLSGLETAALRNEFWTIIMVQFAIGLPIVLAMFGLSVYALRRAERFQEEVARRETAEAALKQAQRLEAIGQLTGGIAHDFNNLLMVVAGNAGRLKRAAAPDDRTRRAFEAIELAVQRGSNLTRQLLSFSRQQTHEAKTIDLRDRLPVIQAMLQASLRGDIAVETEIAGDVWATRVDLGEFELALLNLAVNARDAMSGGGRLRLAARNIVLVQPNALELEGEFVSVAVSDTGAGIPPEIIGRVFEPFFTTKDVGKGTGLGMSQVYGFARQAGGTATVDSLPGRGTTVTLYLPRSTAPVDAVNGEAGAQRPVVRQNVKVLLVEDNPDVATVTQGLLEELGCTVVAAIDVTAALAVLQNRRDGIDVVLSDIVMPGTSNGLDLARHINQLHGDSLPVILATGYSDQAQAAAQEGFTILRKPYDTAALQAALVEVLKKARPQVA